MVKKILITLLLIAGMLSLQAHKAERKCIPVADELNTRINMVTSKERSIVCTTNSCTISSTQGISVANASVKISASSWQHLRVVAGGVATTTDCVPCRRLPMVIRELLNSDSTS